MLIGNASRLDFSLKAIRPKTKAEVPGPKPKVATSLAKQEINFPYEDVSDEVPGQTQRSSTSRRGLHANPERFCNAVLELTKQFNASPENPLYLYITHDDTVPDPTTMGFLGGTVLNSIHSNYMSQETAEQRQRRNGQAREPEALNYQALIDEYLKKIQTEEAKAEQLRSIAALRAKRIAFVEQRRKSKSSRKADIKSTEAKPTSTEVKPAESIKVGSVRVLVANSDISTRLGKAMITAKDTDPNILQGRNLVIWGNDKNPKVIILKDSDIANGKLGADLEVIDLNKISINEDFLSQLNATFKLPIREVGVAKNMAEFISADYLAKLAVSIMSAITTEVQAKDIAKSAALKKVEGEETTHTPQRSVIVRRILEETVNRVAKELATVTTSDQLVQLIVDNISAVATSMNLDKMLESTNAESQTDNSMLNQLVGFLKLDDKQKQTIISCIKEKRSPVENISKDRSPTAAPALSLESFMAYVTGQNPLARAVAKFIRIALNKNRLLMKYLKLPENSINMIDTANDSMKLIFRDEQKNVIKLKAPDHTDPRTDFAGAKTVALLHQNWLKTQTA